MFRCTPTHKFIEETGRKLGISRAEIVRRCGFRNVTKGLRRLEALCDGAIETQSAKMILSALPAALETSPLEVEKAVKETATIIACARAEEEAKRDALWRETFIPSAYLVGTGSKPSSITMYGLSGGAERWLKIPLGLSQPPVTFATQALAVVRNTPEVPFFGATKGFIVNFTPDRTVEFDTTGDVVASYDRAYRPGEVEFFIGRQKVPETWLSGQSIT